MGEVTILNPKQGTTVFSARKAIVVSKKLEKILKDLLVQEDKH
jgi:hypothetical protein